MPDSSHCLSLFCIWAVVAKVLIDEVEVLVGHENHVAVETLPHLDEVLSAGRDDASYTAVTARQRRAVGNQDAHTRHANPARCSTRDGCQLTDGTRLAHRAWQLLVYHLILVHDEEDAVLEVVVPRHEEIGHASQHYEDRHENEEASCDVPQFHPPEVALAASQ